MFFAQNSNNRKIYFTQNSNNRKMFCLKIAAFVYILLFYNMLNVSTSPLIAKAAPGRLCRTDIGFCVSSAILFFPPKG